MCFPVIQPLMRKPEFELQLLAILSHHLLAENILYLSERQYPSGSGKGLHPTAYWHIFRLQKFSNDKNCLPFRAKHSQILRFLDRRHSATNDEVQTAHHQAPRSHNEPEYPEITIMI